MLRQCVNRGVDEMAALVAHEVKGAAESSEDGFVKKLGCFLGGIA